MILTGHGGGAFRSSASQRDLGMVAVGYRKAARFWAIRWLDSLDNPAASMLLNCPSSWR